jgi:hypothetical protein
LDGFRDVPDPGDSGREVYLSPTGFDADPADMGALWRVNRKSQIREGGIPYQ